MVFLPKGRKLLQIKSKDQKHLSIIVDTKEMQTDIVHRPVTLHAPHGVPIELRELFFKF